MTCETRNNSARFVLLADDNHRILLFWSTVLEKHGISTLMASTIDELNRVFARYQSDISAIILDGCIPGNTLNTIDFVRRVRKDGFENHIVASSSDPDYRREMLDKGCCHQAHKMDAPFVVADLLGKTVG